MDEKKLYHDSFDTTEDSLRTGHSPESQNPFAPEVRQTQDEYQDISSTSDTGPVILPAVDARYTAPQSQYSYSSYREQFAHQSAEPAATSPVKKKKGKGRQTAMMACGLTLALCLGFGGGVMGSYLMNRTATPTESSQTEKEKVKQTAANTSSEDELKIVESSNSGKATNSIQAVVKQVKQSVVEITTESTSYDSFYGQYYMQGAGSGVIITDDGYIITNNHVIEGASNINVTLSDGQSYKAEVKGTDEELDIALIKIDATGLTTATFGSSADLEIGETAIVIGNPLGKLGGSVSAGIISSTSRNIKIDGQSMELIQTDAAINPGNSGGGLFDANGNLIGIIVAKSTSTSGGTTVEGIGYAIPIDNVKNILDDLKSKGYVSGRPVLGVSLVDVSDDNAKRRYGVEETGVYISKVEKDGAADKAGLVVGDLIKKFDGKEVSSYNDVLTELQKKKAGDKVDIVISRDGEEKTVSVTLAESLPDSQKEQNSNNFNVPDNNNPYGGMDGYDDLPDDIYRYFTR